MAMRERQSELCAICGLWMKEEETTFDHEDGRGIGGGHRDDRIEVDGEPQNAAVHLHCNVRKGSKRTPYLIQPQADFNLPIEALLPEGR